LHEEVGARGIELLFVGANEKVKNSFKRTEFNANLFPRMNEALMYAENKILDVDPLKEQEEFAEMTKPLWEGLKSSEISKNLPPIERWEHYQKINEAIIPSKKALLEGMISQLTKGGVTQEKMFVLTLADPSLSYFVHLEEEDEEIITQGLKTKGFYILISGKLQISKRFRTKQISYLRSTGTVISIKESDNPENTDSSSTDVPKDGIPNSDEPKEEEEVPQNREEVKLAKLYYPGTIIGEIQYIRNEIATATVRSAAPHTMLLFVTKEKMNQFRKAHPMVAMQIENLLAYSLSERFLSLEGNHNAVTFTDDQHQKLIDVFAKPKKMFNTVVYRAKRLSLRRKSATGSMDLSLKGVEEK